MYIINSYFYMIEIIINNFACINYIILIICLFYDVFFFILVCNKKDVCFFSYERKR